MSLLPPPKMLSRLRDEEGRAYHDATMRERQRDAMELARIKEQKRIKKLRGGMAGNGLAVLTISSATVASNVGWTR